MPILNIPLIIQLSFFVCEIIHVGIQPEIKADTYYERHSLDNGKMTDCLFFFAIYFISTDQYPYQTNQTMPIIKNEGLTKTHKKAP